MYAKNALIVDDSRTARAVLKNRLNEFDVVVESATDGMHALELLRHSTPDVIFLDHVMPGMDGFEVLEHLKNNQTTRNIPVVMYTSQAAPMYTQEAKSLGAVAVIPKQVSDEQLSTALDKAELYHLTAANEDVHGPAFPEAANDANGASESAIPKPAKPGSYEPVKPPRRREDAGFDTPAPVVEISDASARAAAHGQSRSTLGRWVVAGAFATLLVTQWTTTQKVQEQGTLIAGLQSQLEQQEQRLPELESEMASQERKMRLETSRQIEFLANILTAQIQQAAVTVPQPAPATVSGEVSNEASAEASQE